MGGIAGIVNFNQDMINSSGQINSMLQKISHRGKDSLGIHATHTACLGSRRQRFTDPSGESQPMHRSIGEHTYTIVYDGELYNAKELRQELLLKGYAFFSHSDTEVLLLSYIEWGPSCPERLNGMFAFAVWEELSQRLFLARDRFGSKPLFYTLKNNAVCFASEIKCMLEYTPPIVDEQGLLEIFALAPARTPGKTPFKGIEDLKPAECLFYSRLGMYIHRYWQFDCNRHMENAEETAVHLKSLIHDSAKKQMPAAAPVCTFLSGGFDSSVISALVSKYLMQKNKYLNSFSIEFPQDELYFKENLYQPDSDSDFIKIITEFLKSGHSIFTCGIEEMAEALQDAVLARDMPGMADVDSSLLLLCREIANNFSVAFSGECADEIFGGYPWFYNNDLLYSESFPWSQSIPLRKKLLNRSFNKLPLESYARERYMETAAETPILNEEPKEKQLRRRMAYMNIKWFMISLLERQDRMGTAAGLEIRAPFCDNDIVDYAWNIPWDIMNYGNMEKGILRLAMKNILPYPIAMRKKSPYPKTHHPDYLKKVSSLLNDILNNKNSRILDLLDAEFLKNLTADPDQIKTPWYGQLMTAPQLIAFVTQLEHWLNTYNIQLDVSL